MAARRFELIEGTSRKFWEIATSGKKQTVAFGRIGAAGTTQAKTFGSPADAERAGASLIASKVKKGYREVGAAAKPPKTNAGTTRGVKTNSARPPETNAAKEPLRAFFLEKAGILLPAHVLRFWEFWSSLSKSDRKALKSALDVEEVFGLFEFCHPTKAGALSKLNADPRCHAWNEDTPPEFVSALSGSRHPRIYGLWIDEPASGEALVVRYWRSGSIDVVGGTLFDALEDAYRHALEQAVDDYGDDALDEARTILDRAKKRAGRPAAKPPLESDRATLKGRIPILSGVGVIAPDAKKIAAGRRHELAKLPALLDAKASREKRIRDALAACAKGATGEALALGHDLIWLGEPAAATPLLVAAYAALGREPLAAVATARRKIAGR